MRLAALLLCSLFAFGQSTAPSTEPKAQPPARSPGQKSQIQDFDWASAHIPRETLTDPRKQQFSRPMEP